jgi:hypothetical protein
MILRGNREAAQLMAESLQIAARLRTAKFAFDFEVESIARANSLCGPGAGRGGSHAKGPCRRLRAMPRPASSSAGDVAGVQQDTKGETR